VKARASYPPSHHTPRQPIVDAHVESQPAFTFIVFVVVVVEEGPYRPGQEKMKPSQQNRPQENVAAKAVKTEGRLALGVSERGAEHGTNVDHSFHLRAVSSLVIVGVRRTFYHSLIGSASG
jgi:hypothetical protein